MNNKFDEYKESKIDIVHKNCHSNKCDKLIVGRKKHISLSKNTTSKHIRKVIESDIHRLCEECFTEMVTENYE
jgi:hypothetical protein